MSQPQLSIIIPVFNRWTLTHNCLQSLREHTRQARDSYEVIVVDNASSDQTPEELPLLGAALFGANFKYMRHETNRNFSGACNAGAGAASGSFLFFLNNDTLLTEGWLPPLLSAFNGPEDAAPAHPDAPGMTGMTGMPDMKGTVGAVGPLLLYPESRRIQHLGIAFSPKFEVIHLYQYFIPAKRFLSRRAFQALTGAALMVPSELFKRLGGFYEGYINGSEDIDFCLRLGEAGFKMHCRSDSVIFHLECQSKGRTKFERENTELLQKRCKHLIKPDLHKFFSGDNYNTRFTPEFNSYPQPKPEFANLLRRKYRDNPKPENLMNLLRIEPAWEDGYKLLAEAYENPPDFSRLCTVYSLLSALIPKIEHFTALGEAARQSGLQGGLQDEFRVGRLDLQNYAAERRRMLVEQSADKQALLDKVKEALDYAENQGDDILLRSVRSWLRRHKF